MSNLVAGMCRGRGGGGGVGVGCLGERNGSLTGGVSSRWSRLLLKPLKGKESDPNLPLLSCIYLDSHLNTNVSWKSAVKRIFQLRDKIE